MSISSSIRKAGPFTGNGITTSFPFAFKVFNTGEVLVVQTDAAGVETTLTLTTDYTVTLNADQDANPGGTVDMITALPVGLLLTLTSAVTETQSLTLTNQGGFYPTVINDALDRLTIITQQILESLARKIGYGVSDTTTGVIPAATERANKFLAFDSSGNVVTSPISVGTITSSIVSDLVTMRSATVTSGEIVQLKSHTTAGDGGGGHFRGVTGAAPGTYVDNNGTIIIPTGGDGSAAWFREDVGYLTPEMFGAKGDGVINDAPAISAAIAALHPTRGGEIKFGAKRYYVASTLSVPKIPSHTLTLSGSSTELYTDQPIAIVSRVPLNLTEAGIIVSDKTVITGITFVGTSLTSQIGIQLGATYGASILDCDFTNLGIGVELRFCLMASVKRCLATNCTTYGFVVSSGHIWTGGTVSNSSSNATVLESCRVFNSAGATASFLIEASSELSINNCVIEGGQPAYGLLYDTLGSTATSQCTVRNIHIETGPTVAGIWIKAGGSFVIDGLRFAAGVPAGAAAIDYSQSYATTGVTVTLRDPSVLPTLNAGADMFADMIGSMLYLVGKYTTGSLISGGVIVLSNWRGGAPLGEALMLSSQGGTVMGLFSSNQLTINSANDGNIKSGRVFLESLSSGGLSKLWLLGSIAFFYGDVQFFNTIKPAVDNTQTVGTASQRWSTIYAGTGTINTSDGRDKTQVQPLSNIEKQVAVALKGLIRTFRFKDAVKLKGTNARIHTGVIAQDVITAFKDSGLNAFDYGIVCYDVWVAEPAVLDDKGDIIPPATKAGSRYGIRYDELLAFIVAAL